MRSYLFLAAAVAALTPGAVLAQHNDHTAHAQESQANPQADSEARPAQNESDHSAHAGEAMPADPHAGHVASAPAPEGAPPDPHADHDAAAGNHPTEAASPPPIAGPPPEAFSGPEYAADGVFGETAMAIARRAELGPMHGGVKSYRVLVDRLEAQLVDGQDAYLFDAQAWYGGDIDKLWLKAEGHGDFGDAFGGAELQALWSHAIGPWFDLQTGVRLDVGPGEDRAHLVLGVQGLAPYWIEVDAAAFVSDHGDVTARIEAEHDMRITQRLILQPRAELEFALQDIPSRAIGSGLSSAAIGARLRYQVTQLFAPYVGVEYEAATGETRDFRRAIGEKVSGLRLLAGVRAWF